MVTAGQQLAATFGPVLRLLLFLSDPGTWPLTKQLEAAEGQAAVSTLALLCNATMQTCTLTLVEEVSGFAQELFGQLDKKLLGMVVALAVGTLLLGMVVALAVGTLLQNTLQPSADAVRAFLFGI